MQQNSKGGWNAFQAEAPGQKKLLERAKYQLKWWPASKQAGRSHYGPAAGPALRLPTQLRANSLDLHRRV
ncbi:conserved hypothetical protein [Ricinus communis]|uniref:Uncharacterized protein n=1 Tax=Ricinus communis TaxID=3988 RepID=B9T0E7_RICCO|nr:conserved hypothetical protein [Ricinus communis]